MIDTKENHSIEILGKTYEVTCDAKKKIDLFKAAKFLDSRMQQIQKSGIVIGIERIAIMAALNLSNEILNNEKSLENEQLKNKFLKINELIDDVYKNS
jgi:cell division protein ZapA